MAESEESVPIIITRTDLIIMLPINQLVICHIFPEIPSFYVFPNLHVLESFGIPRNS